MKLIHDHEMLDSFLNFITLEAGDFTNTNPFYMHLLARKKDKKDNRNDTRMLHRSFGTTAQIAREIRKLDILTEAGFFNEYEQDMCLYLGVNVRDVRKATLKLTQDLITQLHDNSPGNLYSSVNYAVQQADTKGRYLVLDYDDNDMTIGDVQSWLTTMGISGFGIKTKGGYHLCVDAATSKKSDQAALTNLIKNSDQGGKHLLSPLPGTVQRGFPVTYFLFQEEV